MKHVLPFVSALLLWLAFPPADLGFLGWAALVPLTVYALVARGRRAFFIAWAAGFVFWTGTLYWLHYTSPWFGPPGVGIYKGLYWGAYVSLVRWACTGERPRVPVAIAAPVVWTTLEFIRSYLFTGLPFMVAGYTTHNLLSFIQIADLGGIWLVTFVVALVNGTLARAFVPPPAEPALSERKRAEGYRWSAVASVAVLVASIGYGAVRLATIQLEDGLKIGIVQPNIPQDYKEIVKGGPSPEQLADIYRRHYERSLEAARQKPDLIVWPEVAIIDGPSTRGGRWFENLRFARVVAPSRETGIAHVIGTQIADYPMESGDASFTNSAVFVDAHGRLIGRFDKIKLVPFSEFMLFGDTLPVQRIVESVVGVRLMEFRRGTEQPVWEVAGRKIGVSICSENYFPEISREFAGKGARTLVNISNDGWFRESAQLDAQLAMAKFRAIENRAHYIRATNTGISAMIEPTGRIAAMIPGKSVAGTLVGVAKVTRTAAPYGVLGDWAAWLCAGLAAGGFLAVKLARRASKN